MLKNFRSIFTLLIVSANIYAQDTIPVADKLVNNLSPINSFSSASGYNPGAMVYTLKSSLSELMLGYEKQSGKAGLLQTGTAHNTFAFRAESYMSTPKYDIWGKASYENKRIDNMRWNESSDYYNIYPYVFADSVGGNHLISEKYSFMGGYARKLKKITWGVQLDYWALMEYRTRDPRPDNNTSDLVFKSGVNYRLTGNYAIGGGILLRKYKQKNGLSFKNTLGRPSIHHMTGLGTDAYLFANNETACLFDGNGYGFNLQLLSTIINGISATLDFQNFSFDKQLNNDQKLVLSSIDEDKYTFDISYLRQVKQQTWGIKLEASHVNRQGEDGKFTHNENGYFVKISSEKQYKNEITATSLSLIYKQNHLNTSWHFIPYCSYLEMEERQKSSERNMIIKKMDIGIKPGISTFIKGHLIHIDGNIKYLQNLDSSLELTDLSPERSIAQVLQSNYNFLSSNAFTGSLSTRFDYIIPSQNMTVYIKCMWEHYKYERGHSNFIELLLGVSL